MIIGEYPCCDEPLMIELPDQVPSYARDICPACGTAVWHKFSRLDPQSWTEDSFLEEFEVNEETKQIAPRQAKDRE